MTTLVWIILLAPLAACTVIFMGGRYVRRAAPWLAIIGSSSALLANTALFVQQCVKVSERCVEIKYVWMQTSSMQNLPFLGIEPKSFGDIHVGFLIDPVNLLMLTLLTVISVFVQMFSVFYMGHEGDRARYFGFMSFFSFSMTGLVLSGNLLQTFIFWELVGLSSYLLIGFWFEKHSASEAARKAFVITRFADLGFVAGLVMLFLALGTLDITNIQGALLRQPLPAWLITAIGILIFSGVAGKSAQFPFHIWLPDAMEGPTPVSALIHSATMVAAGVFLLARIFPVFAASTTTMLVILAIGGLTSVLAATLASVQRDIKRVLAYSTISQLGFMIMAVGSWAWVEGLFHLSTHAFFKALLFLVAGSFIHHLGTTDIFEMGRRGAKERKFLVAILLFGVLSLAGIPPLAGFFSKDAILHHLHTQGYWIAYFVGIIVTLLTAFYSFRLLFILTLSQHTRKSQGRETPAHLHVFEEVPLAILAIGSLYVCILGTPLVGEKLLLWLDPYFEIPVADWDMYLTTFFIVPAGAFAAYRLYRDPKPFMEEARAKRPLFILLLKKYYVDDLYYFLVKTVVLRVARLFHWFDLNFATGVMVNQTAYAVRKLGRIFSRIQNGLFQDYLFFTMVLVALALGYILRMS